MRRRKNPEFALAYAEKIQAGPVTEEDVNGHYNMLQCIPPLLSALSAMERPLWGKLKDEYLGLVEPLRRFLNQIAIPMPIVAEPVRRGPPRKIPGMKHNPGLATYKLSIYNLDPTHNYVMVMPSKKQAWATFYAKSQKEATRIAKAMRAETNHKIKLMRLP